MSNERYLIVSYFAFAALCFGLGLLVYYILRKPFERVADSIVGNPRQTWLKRTMVLSMTAASVLGFLGVSYNQHGCTQYEQVIKERAYLVDRNIEQVQNATSWIVWTLLLWCVVIGVALAATRKQKSDQ
jgi:MFS family permease